MDDWLRSSKQLEINVAELKKYKGQKTFTRNWLREFKQHHVIKGAPVQEENSRYFGPTFEIDNSENILLLQGDETDTKILIESFLQANVGARTKYKCCVLHHCCRENKLTCDSYYMMKNIIFQIINTVPSIKNYISIQDHFFLKEVLSKSTPDKLELQNDYPDVLVKFFKTIKELRLD